MSIILKYAKHIISILVLLTVLITYIATIYNLTYPILPDIIINKVDNNVYTKFLLKGNKPFYTSLFELFILTSFFVVSFKLFPDRNVFTKILLGSFFLVGTAMIASMARSKEIEFIFMLLPIVLMLILLIFRQKKKGNILNDTIQKKFSKKKGETKGFVFKTTRGNIYLDNPYRGIYIQGGAGSGKSLSLFEPIIEQMTSNGYTGLLYDFKSPELTTKVMEVYQKQNLIKNYFVDFKNPYISHRVNPINPKYLLKTAYALEYSTALVNNLLPESIKKPDFWTNNAKMIIAGVIWYIKNNYPHYCTLPHVISLLLHTDVDKLINTISEDYEAGGFTVSLRQSIERGAEKQVAGILSTIQNGFSQLNTPDIFWILSGNDLDLHLNNPNNPKFVCVGNDSTLSQTYSPVISLIISVAIRLMNQPNQEKSIILLDEAPTIYIPNIEQLPATARSNKVATVFGVQDYSQLVDKYGQEKAQVILSNLGNHFYGRTVNAKSVEMIKNLFGRYDKTYKTRSKGMGTSGELVHLSSNTNKGTSESIQERDRVKVSDITNLGAGQFYGLIAEGQPSEFFKTQFIAQEIKASYQSMTKATDQQMIDNYNRIVEEAKSIVL